MRRPTGTPLDMLELAYAILGAISAVLEYLEALRAKRAKAASAKVARRDADEGGEK